MLQEISRRQLHPSEHRRIEGDLLMSTVVLSLGTIHEIHKK